MRKALRLGFLSTVLAVLALASCNLTAPTGDFNITVMVKTPAHPLYNVGSSIGYVVNGVEGAPITLTRGQTYTFGVDSPGHPFYLSTNKDGGTGFPGEYTTGVTGSRTEFGLLTIITDANTPSTLYYDCGVHLDMGGTITVTP